MVQLDVTGSLNVQDIVILPFVTVGPDLKVSSGLVTSPGKQSYIMDYSVSKLLGNIIFKYFCFL